MDRYLLFRKLMDMVSDDYEVTGANMFNFSGDMEITGNDGEQTIKITVALKEVKQDA